MRAFLSLGQGEPLPRSGIAREMNLLSCASCLSPHTNSRALGRPRGQERGVRPGGAADRQRVERPHGAGLGRGLRRQVGLPPRARPRGRERGVRPGGAADRQQVVVGRHGAGLGRGLRHRTGLPPRARRRGLLRGVRPGGSADRQRVEGQDGAGVGRGLRRRAGLPPRARPRGRERGVRPGGAAPRWPASAGTTKWSRAWRSTGRVGGS